MKLSIAKLKDADFAAGGLRDYFTYRDLGIAQATGGKAGAQVIRAVPGKRPPNAKHRHSLDFQMIYILKGWAVFWYEGEGEVRLEAGDCVHQPPGILHAQSDQSDDLEILEITLPASFETEMAE